MDEDLTKFKQSGLVLMDFLNGHINDLTAERDKLCTQMNELDKRIADIRAQREYVEMAVISMDVYLSPQPEVTSDYDVRAAFREGQALAEPTTVRDIVDAVSTQPGERVEVVLKPAPSPVPDPHHTSLRAWITAKLQANGAVKVKQLAQELRATGAHNANQQAMQRLSDNIGWHLRNLVTTGDARRVGPGKYVWVANANH